MFFSNWKVMCDMLYVVSYLFDTHFPLFETSEILRRPKYFRFNDSITFYLLFFSLICKHEVVWEWMISYLSALLSTILTVMMWASIVHYPTMISKINPVRPVVCTDGFVQLFFAFGLVVYIDKGSKTNILEIDPWNRQN